MENFSENQFSQAYRDSLTILIDLSLEEMDGEEILAALEAKVNDSDYDALIVDRVDAMYYEQTDQHLDGEELVQFISLLSSVVKSEPEPEV